MRRPDEVTEVYRNSGTTTTLTPFRTGQICRETSFYVSLCHHRTMTRVYDGWVFPACPVGPHSAEWVKSLVQG